MLEGKKEAVNTIMIMMKNGSRLEPPHRAHDEMPIYAPFLASPSPSNIAKYELTLRLRVDIIIIIVILGSQSIFA